jgi:hypothetical protein
LFLHKKQTLFFKNYVNSHGNQGVVAMATIVHVFSAEFSGKRYFQQYGPVVDFINNKVEDKFNEFPEYSNKVLQWIREVWVF